jgi:outer membrane protein assembly factor BamB
MGVAGDLVFFGESNGLFHAADARTGKILWTYDASTVPNAGGANASPAFYVVNEKEYVVYGFGGEPGNSPVLGDAVIAFALSGDDEADLGPENRATPRSVNSPQLSLWQRLLRNGGLRRNK